ncbi:MAG: 4Fe-4S dicluster domain-containing protein [Brevinematales bacterium]|nr:4Fe-4S dicluster domain-containing protein [Brevinematales bacterium]
MNFSRILRFSRLFSGLIFLLIFSLMFLGVLSLTPLSKLQFIPAIFNFKNGILISSVVILAHLLLTSILGRVYCSFFCPFGFLQDLFVSWKKTFSFRKIGWIFVVFAIAFFFVAISYLNFVVGFLDPYSLFGKVVILIVKPIFSVFINGLHYVLPFVENVRSYEISFWLLIIFSFYLIFIFLFSLVFGRFFCNYICPSGAIFRFFSSFSVFKLSIDETKCIKCMRCERVCPALCINVKELNLDYSRCLLCLRCLSCPKEAIGFKSVFQTNFKRGEFFNLSKSFFIFFFLKNKLFALTDYRKLRHLPSPPGSISIEYLKQNCVSCLLCVSHCPSKVLKPSFDEYGLDGIFMPVMNYPKSFCLYECNACGRVCPTKAITPFSLEEKKTIQIGRVKLIKEKCIVYRDKVDCGACSEVCPTKAVFMVGYEDGLFAPETETKYCVGCGACENVCPALPEKAIYVEGHIVHNKATLREKDKKENIQKSDDFPF